MKHVTEKLSNLFDIIIKVSAGFLLSICSLWFVGVIILYMFTENTTAVAEDSPAAAENQPAAIECGSCGAHVYEYWYVGNINDGTPVEVCRYCYENYVANTDTEN